MKYLKEHPDFDWCKETCEIVKSCPKSDAFHLVSKCFFDKVRIIVDNSELVLNKSSRMLYVFEQHMNDFENCSRTNIDVLRKCVHDVSLRFMKFIIFNRQINNRSIFSENKSIDQESLGRKC